MLCTASDRVVCCTGTGVGRMDLDGGGPGGM